MPNEFDSLTKSVLRRHAEYRRKRNQQHHARALRLADAKRLVRARRVSGGHVPAFF
jgi:hypothetical protein